MLANNTTSKRKNIGLGAALLAVFLFLSLTLAPVNTQALTNVQPDLLALADTQPDANVRVIVYKANADSTLEGLVTKLDGTVVSDLHLINALAVELPAKAIPALARSSSVAQITLDGEMMSAQIITETIADNFDNKAYNNNNGTQPWSSNWTEINDDNEVDGGKVKIDKELLKLEETERGIQRTADLSDADTAVLTFQYRREKFKKDKTINLEISADGGATWNQIAQINGDVNESTFQTASHDISAYAGSSVILRFFSGPTGDGKLWVDNLQIEYTVGNISPPPPDDSTTAILRDEFTAVAFDGNNGDTPWVGSWIEDDPNSPAQDPASGFVQILNGELRINNQNFDDTHAGVVRAANLSGYVTEATLNFDFRTSWGVDGADGISVEVSPDGGASYITTSLVGLRPAPRFVFGLPTSTVSIMNTSIWIMCKLPTPSAIRRPRQSTDKQ